MSDQDVRKPRARWRLGCLVAVVALPLTAIAYFNVPGVMTGDSLVTSLGRQDRVRWAVCYSANAIGKRDCVLWSIGDAPGGAYVDSYAPSETYEVVVRGRCWTARKTEASDVQPPMPTVLSDCIVIGDNFRVLSRVLRDDPNDRFELHPDDQ